VTSFQSTGASSSQDPDEEPDYLVDCDLSDLLRMFREIEDTRGRNGRQHELPFVFGVCVVAVLAGAKGYAEIARRARGMSHACLRRSALTGTGSGRGASIPARELPVECCPGLMPG
jgi:hypothetical protein